MAAPDFAFDGVVRITRLGTAYLVFTLFLGLAALNTGNNSLYIAQSLVLGSLILSGILSWRGLRSIRVEFLSSDTVWAGIAARGELRVTNRSRWISPRDVILVSPQFESPVLIDELTRGRERIVPASLLFQHRGRTRLESVELYSRYPLGLFLKRWILPLDGDLVVLPRLLSPAEASSVAPDSSGTSSSRDRVGFSGDLYGFREYKPGDSLRQVNWKKSARIGRWILRMPQAEGDALLHVVVDPWLPAPGLRDRLENEISRAATAIHYAPGPVDLHLPGRTLRAGGRDRLALLQALALLEVSHERHQILAPRGARIFGLSGRGEHDAAVA